jgi:hypothetical protein
MKWADSVARAVGEQQLCAYFVGHRCKQEWRKGIRTFFLDQMFLPSPSKYEKKCASSKFYAFRVRFLQLTKISLMGTQQPLI